MYRQKHAALSSEYRKYLTLYGHTKTAEQLTIIQQYSDWYTGRRGR